MGAIPDWKIRELCHEELFKATYPLKPFKPLLDPFLDYPKEGEGREETQVSSGLTSHGYDLRLGPAAKLCVVLAERTLYPKGMTRMDYFEVHPTEDGYFTLPPWGALLTHSVEYFRMPADLEASAIGKSTYARLNIFVNTTPIEAGWEGNLTIEVVNLSDRRVGLKAGEGICQVKFYEVDAPEKSYAGKYQGSKGVQIAL